MAIRMAFMFRVKQPNKTTKYYVKIAEAIDYVNGRVAWMDDPRMPQWNDWTNSGTLVPDIDITAECHECESEDAALRFMAEHYANEIAML